jgi:2-methylaconitate cis-trans-isomerase PrpF
VSATVERRADGYEVVAGQLFRTARKLFEGKVYAKV